ncbi:hypothetical protein KYK29_11520 [Shinella daejeonensis]|nr:hypothetical protein [Shinella daejeonensis]MCP8895551.1 hypothetical protein [Shinella daejeonensis]
MARISVMTTLFASLALDITVPLLVLSAGLAVSAAVFVVGDFMTLSRRAA